MAIIAVFEVEGATASKYDEVIRRLTEIGQWHPEGQLCHVCYGDKQQLQVIDIFDNHSSLEAFGAKLLPILQDLGIRATPTVYDVYNIVGTSK